MATITIVSTGGTRAPCQLELADRLLAERHEVRRIATKNALRFLWSHIARRPRRLGFYARMYRPQLLETRPSEEPLPGPVDLTGCSV